MRQNAIIASFVSLLFLIWGCSDTASVETENNDTTENASVPNSNVPEISVPAAISEPPAENISASGSTVTSNPVSGSYSEDATIISKERIDRFQNNLTCASPEAKEKSLKIIEAAQMHYISGEIEYNILDGINNDKILRYDKTISAEFNPLTLIDSPPDLFIFPFISGYRLELMNEYGNVVSKIPVRVLGADITLPAFNLQWPNNKLPFDTWIVDPPEFNSYALYNHDKLLASVDLSEHFPEVEVIEPKACKIISENEFEVFWMGSDKDNDALVYSVWYLFFDEQAGFWGVYMIADNLQNTYLSIKRSQVYHPTSSQSRIRIIVSDGTRSSYAESEIFAVSNAPSVTIDNYEDGETYETTEFILSAWTTGFAYSTLDDPVSFIDLNFKWHSNINGFLGSGDQIQATLSSGNHTITVTVSDKYGNSASDTIEFKVRNELY